LRPTPSATTSTKNSFGPPDGPSASAGRDAGLERQTMRTISLRLLPLLFALYIASQLDRMNAGIAALEMNRAIGLDAAAYSLGYGMLFLGYSLFEVPSNIVLLRTGARRWIARIAITWGLLSAATMFARGPFSFSALRFLLGVAEAGYFPGIVFYLTRWFPERYRARAISRFMLGLPLATIIGGWAGGALLGLDGRFGLAGWQWLFVVEGLPTVLLGIVVLFILTERPAEASWLSADEKAWLSKTLEDEAARAAPRDHGILEALRNPTVWMIALPYFGTNFAMLSVNAWAPTITKELLQLTNLQVGVLTGIIGLAALAGMLTNGWHSDGSGERHVHTMVPISVSSIALIVAASSRQAIVVVAALAVVTVCHSTMFPALWCLPSFLRGAGAAAGIALINSFGIFGGFVGTTLVGRVKSSTGSYSPALYVLAASSFGAVALIAWLRATRARHRERSHSRANEGIGSPAEVP
jgi:ACS family tartrate transporter-like MFS transporter